MYIKELLRRYIKRIKYNLPQKIPEIIPSINDGNFIGFHISAFSEGNAGDTLLPVVLRDLFCQTIRVKSWDGMNVRKKVSNSDVQNMNRADFVVIGGGGLFLCDTNPNQLSGWQWSCSIDQLKKIQSPIIGFAIGYNRFRGQEDFSPIFAEHLNLFVEKAVFVGIRNHGSIEALKPYLHTDKLRNKLVYQPCMTTLISKIYPQLADYTKKEDFVVINCAFDRQHFRSSDDSYLYSIARVAKELCKMTKVKYYSHMKSDLQALPYFDKIGVKYELVEMHDVKKMISDYARPRLVIGMRGHAQMIPFGCQTPILSIISHNKMQWFLDDISHPDWGVEVNSMDFEEKLYTKAKTLYINYLQAHNEIVIQQQKLWEITQNNLYLIKNQLI